MSKLLAQNCIIMSYVQLSEQPKVHEPILKVHEPILKVHEPILRTVSSFCVVARMTF